MIGIYLISPSVKEDCFCRKGFIQTYIFKVAFTKQLEQWEERIQKTSVVNKYIPSCRFFSGFEDKTDTCLHDNFYAFTIEKPFFQKICNVFLVESILIFLFEKLEKNSQQTILSGCRLGLLQIYFESLQPPKFNFSVLSAKIFYLICPGNFQGVIL